MKYLVFCYISLFCFGFISCKEDKVTKIENLVEEWSGKEILFPVHPLFSLYGKSIVSDTIPFCNYKIISYVDSLGCTDCKLKLDRWTEFISEMDNMGLNIPILYFIHPSDLQELKSILRREKFDYPVCIDIEDSLNKLNHFSTEMTFQTFLLDKDNKVVAIGNPIHNPKVKELYLNIIQGKTTMKAKELISTEIQANESTISLGNFNWQEEQIANFVIHNVGKHPLVINDVTTSCGCTSVEYSKEPVRPGDSIALQVTYKADNPEHFNKTITVYCNTNPSLIHLKIVGDAE